MTRDTAMDQRRIQWIRYYWKKKLSFSHISVHIVLWKVYCTCCLAGDSDSDIAIPTQLRWTCTWNCWDSPPPPPPHPHSPVWTQWRMVSGALKCSPLSNIHFHFGLSHCWTGFSGIHLVQFQPRDQALPPPSPPGHTNRLEIHRRVSPHWTFLLWLHSTAFIFILDSDTTEQELNELFKPRDQNLPRPSSLDAPVDCISSSLSEY